MATGRSQRTVRRPAPGNNRTKPLTRLLLSQIARRLTDGLKAKVGRNQLLLMRRVSCRGPSRLFESALVFMASYGLKSFLVAQSLNQIEKAYGPNDTILDNCHVGVSDTGIAIETSAVFIRFWLATTPAPPEPAAQAARATAGERYDTFVTALGRRLAKGPKMRQEIPFMQFISVISADRP